MKNRFLILFALLVLPFAPAYAQTLLPGSYRQLFFDGTRVLTIDVTTNGPITLHWLSTQPITGEVRRDFSGSAILRANGRIVGRFPAHGYLRGRAKSNGTNGIIGTLWIRDMSGQLIVRRFELNLDDDQ